MGALIELSSVRHGSSTLNLKGKTWGEADFIALKSNIINWWVIQWDIIFFKGKYFKIKKFKFKNLSILYIFKKKFIYFVIIYMYAYAYIIKILKSNRYIIVKYALHGCKYNKIYKIKLNFERLTISQADNKKN